MENEYFESYFVKNTLYIEFNENNCNISAGLY